MSASTVLLLIAFLRKFAKKIILPSRGKVSNLRNTSLNFLSLERHGKILNPHTGAHVPV